MREKVVQQVKQTSISIVQNSISAIRRKNIQKTGCRVINDNKIGVASGLGNVKEDELFARAENALSMGVEYPVEPSCARQRHDCFDGLKIADEQLCSTVEKVLSEIKQCHPDFVVSNKANLSNISLCLENDAELSLSYKDCYISWSFVLKDSNSPGIMDTFFGLVTAKWSQKKSLKQLAKSLRPTKTRLNCPPAVYLL